MSTKPWLVLIDLQRDFYHPQGTYGQAGRPLEPINSAISNLIPLVKKYPRVLRVKSHYQPRQWPDMPGLCADPEAGGRWHPQLEVGPLVVKRKQSAFSAISSFFNQQPRPLLLAGVCTHRCVKATLEDLLAAGWPAKVLESGVASCGYRQEEHEECLAEWKEMNLVKTVSCSSFLVAGFNPNFKESMLSLLNLTGSRFDELIY